MFPGDKETKYFRVRVSHNGMVTVRYHADVRQGSEKLAEHFLARSGLEEDKLHVVARVNDQEAIKNLVAGGLGVSLISARAAENFLLEKRILAFELPEYLAARHMYIIYRKDYLLPSYVQEFIRFINTKANKR